MVFAWLRDAVDSWSDLLDVRQLASETGPAARLVYGLQRRQDGGMSFRRRLAPRAVWAVGAAGILLAGVLVLAISLLVGSDHGPGRIAESLGVRLSLGWALTGVSAAAVVTGAIRQRHRPREIIFEPQARQVRLVPGGTFSFEQIEGVHAHAWRDLAGLAPHERYQLYLRIRGRRITLAEPASMRETEDLANELKALIGAG